MTTREQRQARRRRREERQLERRPPPEQPSLFQRIIDWFQQHWIVVAAAFGGIAFLAVVGYAFFQAVGSENTTSTEEAEQAEQDDSPEIAGEFHPSEGRNHVAEDVEYSTAPPTSGPHDPVPLPPAVYRDPAQAPEERAVHSMEHGSVIIWYNCEAGGLSEEECTAMVDRLREIGEDNLVSGQTATGVIVVNYPAMEDHLLGVTSWTRLLYLDELDEEAISRFINDNLCRYDPEGFCD
jgi:Protein of unknown function (DUF3105)